MRTILALAFLMLSCGGPRPGDEDMGGGALQAQDGQRLKRRYFIAADGMQTATLLFFDTQLNVTCSFLPVDGNSSSRGPWLCVPLGSKWPPDQPERYVSARLTP